MPTNFLPVTVADYAHRTKENIELYEGRAFNVLNTDQLELDIFSNNDPLAPQKNFYKLITDTFVNLSVFEPVEIALKQNQKWFDEYAENTDFQDFIKEAFKIGSIKGDTIALIYAVGDDFFKVEIIENSIWTPEIDSDNVSVDSDVNTLTYTYYINKVSYKVQKQFVYDKTNNKTFTEIIVKIGENSVSFDNIPEMIKNKFGLLNESSFLGVVEAKVFFRFQNEKSLRDYFGLSDYTENVIAMTNLINNLLALEYYVQVKTGKAMLAVPDSLLSSAEDMANKFISSGEETQNVFNSFGGLIKNTFDNLAKIISKKEKLKKLDFIPMKAGDNPPQFIQPTSTVAEIEITINKLKQELFEDLALPTVLISNDMQVGQLTGVALQKMMQRTLHKKNAREIRMKKFLRDVISNLIILNKKPAEKPTIKFGDGIVNDRKEKIEEIQMLLNIGLITRVDAVKELYGLTETQAIDYIAEIDLQNGNINDGLLIQEENLENTDV